MATLVERACRIGDGASSPLEMSFFKMGLELYAAEVVPLSFFERAELSLDVGQMQQLVQLLATMPETAAERGFWITTVLAIFDGGRLPIEQLDDALKVETALGLAP